MHAAVYYSNTDVRIEEFEKPQIGPGELLVKIMACGICGTDVLEWYRVKRAPLVLGHEATGKIIQVGECVDTFKKGQRVFISHHVPCNSCHYCLAEHHTACETLHKTNYLPGGFAEYIRVPKIIVEQGVFILPKEITFFDGTLIEPLGCVIRGQRLANVHKDDTILVLGSGVSGLLHIKLAREKAVKNIVATDVNEYRLKTAKDYGANFIINAKNEDVHKRLLEVNENRLADRVIICTGAKSACEQALACVDRGGTILFFAVPEPTIRIPVSFSDFWRNEVTLLTSYGAAPSDILEAITLIGNHKVKVRDMITHRLSLNQTEMGFRLVAESGESLKVVIEPNK